MHVSPDSFGKSVNLPGFQPSELRWQSGRLLTDRSLVRSQVGASFCQTEHRITVKTIFLSGPQMSDAGSGFKARVTRIPYIGFALKLYCGWILYLGFGVLVFILWCPFGFQTL